jgi:hypothetical protein
VVAYRRTNFEAHDRAPGWREVGSGGVVTDYDTWVALFAATLVGLRPHLTAKVAQRLAIEAFDGTDTDPKAAVRAYLFAHGGTLQAARE